MMHKVVSSFLQTMDLASTTDLVEATYVPIINGSAAALFRFDVKDRSYVLRILPPQASHITRTHEVLLAQRAGEVGIGPKIHFVAPHLEAFITDFISGRTVNPLDFQNLSQLGQFAQLLQKLHSSPGKIPVACSPFQRFHNFLAKSEQRGLILSPKLSEVKRLMEEIEEIFRLHDIPLVPCHLDLHSENIMLREKDFVVVDWVNGGLSNPYFDLATFAIFHGLNEFQTTAFLTTYFGQPPRELEWSLFRVAQPLRLFVIALGCLSMSSEGSTSYNDASLDSEVIPFRDYIYMPANEKLNLALWKIGLMMLKAGLDQVDKKNFKNSLQYLHDNII
ncbi:MAG: phosphotransferase [Alphaproteobacteria bacterium]|nr:phosphotransferase [Alphaproteobacteria bacterium]